MMVYILIIFQLYILEVNAIRRGSAYYARISPEIAFNTNKLMEVDGVSIILCDSTLVGTQHFKFYGCQVPYYRLNCDIVHNGRAYYMDKTDYLNDKSTLKNLIE